PLLPALSIPGAHCAPLNFNTWPVVGLAPFNVMPKSLFTVGLGYVPDKSPPAVPFGGSVVGITPAASLPAVIEASTIFKVLTELSASLFVVTAFAAMLGSGWLRVRAPAAVPVRVAFAVCPENNA